MPTDRVPNTAPPTRRKRWSATPPLTGDYRLQSVYVLPDGPVDPADPDEPTPPVLHPGENGNAAIPANARLAVAPQVPAYLTAGVAFQFAALADIDSLHRRLGEVRDDRELDRDGGEGENVRARLRRQLQLQHERRLSAVRLQRDGRLSGRYRSAAMCLLAGQKMAPWRAGLAGTIGQLHFEPEAVDGPQQQPIDDLSPVGLRHLSEPAGLVHRRRIEPGLARRHRDHVHARRTPWP